MLRSLADEVFKVCAPFSPSLFEDFFVVDTDNAIEALADVAVEELVELIKGFAVSASHLDRSLLHKGLKTVSATIQD